jgi:hypothetical protein
MNALEALSHPLSKINMALAIEFSVKHRLGILPHR